MIRIKRGLDLPIAGSPEQTVFDGPKIRSVGLVGFDYVGMKPTMAVAEGDRVRTGDLLFTDKKNPAVRFTAPATGVVAAINRGEKRILQSVAIDVEADDFVEFEQYSESQLAALTHEQVEHNLVQSGLWTALRTRPFSKIPTPGTKPHSLFVTAMDTHPLAARADVIIDLYQQDFMNGLAVLSHLTDGRVFVCKAPAVHVPVPEVNNVQVEEFAGPHPAGLPGTHIHFIDSASAAKQVWYIGYQDVIAVGKLFTTGTLWTDRIVALGGPQVEDPRLVRTRLGASLDELTAGQLKPGDNRVVSGSVLGGRAAAGPTAYLGRYHYQISVLLEGREREFMGWLSAGANKFSVARIYLSQFVTGRRFNFTTTTNGSERAMVPIGSYERVMPLDILPTQLLRSLIVGDTQTAQQLGALELDEEDLALCTFVCPGKYEYGPILRDNLTRIELEG